MAKITRRQWAASLAVSAIPLSAQEPAPEKKLSPEEWLAQAKADLREQSEKLQKFLLEMSTEPVFVFKP